jgi:hypothetical protein
MAFERILASGDVDCLLRIWRKSNAPWDRGAFDRLLETAPSDCLRGIYRRSNGPWDREAKAKLERRGAWG